MATPLCVPRLHDIVPCFDGLEFVGLRQLANRLLLKAINQLCGVLANVLRFARANSPCKVGEFVGRSNEEVGFPRNLLLELWCRQNILNVQGDILMCKRAFAGLLFPWHLVGH